MAVAVSITLLEHAIASLKDRSCEKHVASMGYPDILATASELDRFVGDHKLLHYRSDSKEICQRHSVQNYQIPDSYSFFTLLGAALDVFDLTAERGGEIIADLNYPWTSSANYDLVIDPGTLEHCFNIGQAAFNMASLVKQGGCILHDNPMVAGNHGFYGMNPTWYNDFYVQNGFALKVCAIYSRQVNEAAMRQTARFLMPQFEHHIIALAERTEVRELVYPTQTKYRRIT